MMFKKTIRVTPASKNVRNTDLKMLVVHLSSQNVNFQHSRALNHFGWGSFLFQNNIRLV